MPLVAVGAPSAGSGPVAFQQVAELTASNTVGRNHLGQSVAVSGGTVVVGAGGHANGKGGAFAFTNTGSGWRQEADLEGPDAVSGDFVGQAVAVSSVVAVAGGVGYARYAGRAFVFTSTALRWERTGELEVPGAPPFSYFGQSVAISGATIVVGANGYGSGAGRAYVFVPKAARWHQVAELSGRDTAGGDLFGESVAISGTTIVVGAVGHANGSGRAYVFTKEVTGWNQTAELVGSYASLLDQFGYSVAISGTTIVVGAVGHASSGRAYVFTKGATGWHQAAELVGSDTVAGDGFGDSVAASNNVIVVGAWSHDGLAGRAYVFVKATGKSRWRLSRTRLIAVANAPPTRSVDMAGCSLEKGGVLG